MSLLEVNTVVSLLYKRKIGGVLAANIGQPRPYASLPRSVRFPGRESSGTKVYEKSANQSTNALSWRAPLVTLGQNTVLPENTAFSVIRLKDP